MDSVKDNNDTHIPFPTRYRGMLR